MYVNVPWTDNNTTYSVGDGGLTQKNFTNALFLKLNGIADNANNFVLGLADGSNRGGVKIGYTENAKNYPVELDSEKMFVNVPWTDNNTTYGVGDGGLTQKNFTTTLKDKLDGIEAGATADQDLSSYATQSYVGTQISNLVGGAPAALNTLNELAAALGDDPNFASSVTNALAGKVAAGSNLSDLPNKGTARTNLGLGSLALQNSGSVAITGGSITGIALDGGTF